MILTNKLRLPEPIVRAITNDTYTKGDADISVTELLNPPQLRRLRIQHDHEIEEDVADRIYSLQGQAMHSIIERAGVEADELSEVTLYTTYLGWKIKGTFDHVSISKGELNDYKNTSAWKVKDGKLPPEWEAQTNIYRRILEREKGITINSVAIIALLRDWTKMEARRNADYPSAPAVRIEVPIWSADKTDAFIEERVRLHQQNPPQPCTDADIWARPDKWAVIKRNNTRATKVFDDPTEAEALAETIAGSRVEHRPGIATRCLAYCPVAKFCAQWQADPRRPADIESIDLFSS